VVPNAFWLAVEFDGDCAGWVLAAAGPPDVGFSHCGFLFHSDDGGLTWTHSDTFCVGGWMNMVSTMVGSDPGVWACCDTSGFSCASSGVWSCQGPDKLFTPGVLCNDLDPPCSQAGACCNLATGQCRASFDSECAGYLEQFTAGATCGEVDCPVPDNVPTVSQWGVFVLCLLFLSGLTIKFRTLHSRQSGAERL